LEKWSATSLRRAGLCADHFHPISFTRKDKKRLKRDAVPIKFNGYSQKESETGHSGMKQSMQSLTQTEIPAEVYLEENINNNVEMANLFVDASIKQCIKTYHPAKLNFDIPEEEENLMEWMHLEPPINKKDNACHAASIINKTVDINKNASEKEKSNITINLLKRENLRLRKIIKNLKCRLRARKVSRKATSKKSKKKIIQNLIQDQNLHPVAKAMINLQLHTPKAPYTQEEKSLSQQLFYYSAAALRRLRQAGCVFPGERTIRRWHEEYNMMPGFCDFIFSKLQEKIAKIPVEERICALKWDEMYIKSYEEYSLHLDQIEGLIDLGPLGRKCERTKCVFVFCLDSINARHPWRQPLAYFLPGKCMKAEEIIILLKECLNRLSKAGADVRIVTCDQGTCNQSAYNQLGVDSDRPYFIYNEKKYYASFDFPHLVKRLASLLRRQKNLFCDGKVIASYVDFEITWSIENAAKGGSNLLSHITEAHIHPNTFEAMNVKRVFQLFSNKFAAAIRTAGYGKELQTNTWEATANFTERMNNVIDACNSYSYNMKFSGKRLLSNKNPDIEIC